MRISRLSKSHIKVLQLQTSPHQFLMFLIKAALLLLITSGVLFQSLLPLNDIDFVPKDVVYALGSMRMSLILKL